jgi:hypothetical protein
VEGKRTGRVISLRFLREIYDDRPSSQTIHAFNRSLEQAGVRPVRHQPFSRMEHVGRYLDHRRRLRNFFCLPGYAFIIALEWPYEERLFPVCYFGEIIPLCFDCWPKDYEKWFDLFCRHRIRIAFFTARQSADHFQRKLPAMKCHWLPEAADPGEYQALTRPVRDRGIDVLELGRKSEKYHAMIRQALVQAGYVHRYRAPGERRMFPTRMDLMEAWGDTKISICFPKTITDPAKAGGVETATFRYFESIASRCLVVGHCPQELEELFGYKPVLEADMDDPAGHLLSILSEIESYQEFIDRNHRRMLEVGGWDGRVQQMLSILSLKGYETGTGSHSRCS